MNPSYLQIGDELLSDALLDTVTVTQELNRHWWLEVWFRQTMDERPPYESYLGRPCQLFTYDENGAQIVAFEGFVFRSQLQYELYGSSRGHLVAVSQSHKMDLTPRHACYTSSSLPAIASQIAALTGLSAGVHASVQTAPKQYVQWAESDFRFLHRLADDHRAWLRPTANGIEVFDMFQGGVPLTFREEYGLLSFDVEGGIGPAAMDGAHYDPRPMASRTYSQITAPPAFTGASGTLTDAILQASQQMPPGYVYDRSRVPALADYEARLKLESERALGSQIVAHGISRELRVKAGDKIEIGGVIRAQGIYGVTKVVHRWTLKGYENEFWATAWEKWLEAEAPARPIVDGVFPARVIQHSDPEKMGRHRIRFWWQEEGEPMLWARMMTPHAGQNRGIFFQPEVGDEVVVMFEDGDPERPVILGCVWNGVDTAPTADFWGGEYADNDIKRIVTKSGNRIQMVDKPGQEAVSLSTPHNLKISMYERANETGRPIIEILNRNGDISFLAPDGRIHFHSQLFSREVGSEAVGVPGSGALSAAHAQPAPAPATGSGNGFLSGVAAFGSGLYEGAVKPLVDLVEHPIQAAEGIGHAIAHPITTAEALGHAIYTGGAQALSGDPHAIGLAMGTAGSMFVPGAGEAEAVGDAAKVSEVAKVAEAAELADAAKAAEVGEAGEASAAAEPVYKAQLRGQEIELSGVQTKQIEYTKRFPQEREALRQAFRRFARRDFLQEISTHPDSIAQLEKAGFRDQQIADMSNGILSPDWQVHHKLPLDDNGTNDFSNLVLIKNDPYHMSLTNAQNALTADMAPGETRTLAFPVPPDGIVVYPSVP